MWTLELPWETWRAIIAYLRDTRLSYAHEHADLIERELERTPADQDPARLSIPDSVFLRSLTLACVGLRIPMPEAR